MKLAAGSHSKTYLLIVLMVLFGPLGNVLLGKGMRSIGPATGWNSTQLLHVFAAASASPFVWFGITCLLLFFIVYMLVLSRADYSYVLPASSIAYAVVALLGHFLLGEVVSPVRWAGVMVICLGVAVVGYTSPSTTEGK